MGIIDQIDASVMHFRAFALHTNTPGRPLVSVIASVGGDCTHSPTCSQATNNPNGMQDLPSGMNLSTQREYWWVPASQRAALQTAGVQIAIASIGATGPRPCVVELGCLWGLLGRAAWQNQRN